MNIEKKIKILCYYIGLRTNVILFVMVLRTIYRKKRIKVFLYIYYINVYCDLVLINLITVLRMYKAVYRTQTCSVVALYFFFNEYYNKFITNNNNYMFTNSILMIHCKLSKLF